MNNRIVMVMNSDGAGVSCRKRKAEQRLRLNGELSNVAHAVELMKLAMPANGFREADLSTSSLVQGSLLGGNHCQWNR